MMKLSTSTNIYCERPGGSVVPVEKTLKYAAEAGFSTFDMSFYEWSCPGSPFFSDQWQQWAEGIARTAQEYGLGFDQCHAYTYDFLNPDFAGEEKRQQQEMLVRRSLDCCRILGAKVAVTHPGMGIIDGSGRKQVWQKNKEYMEQLLAYADARGMTVAVENMYDSYGHPEQKFFVFAEEITAFIDEFGDSRLGVCWDFEHGAIMEMDQPPVIRQLGKRLMATHVSDTLSKDFEPFMHVMPFTGLTEWGPIMQALKDISYEGAFSLEAHNFIKKLPDQLVPAALYFSRQIGQYLLAL